MPIWKEGTTEPALPEALSKTQASTVSYNKNNELKKKKQRQKECGFKLHGLYLKRCPASCFEPIYGEYRWVMEPQPQPSFEANSQGFIIQGRNYSEGL